MNALRVLGSRLLGTLRSRQRDAQLGEEISSHLAFLTDEFIARGLSPVDAHLAARREFGGIAVTREAARETRGFPVVHSLWQDLTYAGRRLRTSPGSSLVIVLSLAIGIGASTATFSVVNAALLRPLPIDRPDEIYVLNAPGDGPMSASVGLGTKLVSYPLFLQLRRIAPEPTTLTAMSRVASLPVTLSAGARPARRQVHLVSGRFFSTLGIQPSHGRALDDRDDEIGNPVAVISRELWETRLAAAPDAIGRPIVINGAAITIVGIAPPGFHGIWLEQPTDIWLPLSLQSTVKYWQNFITHDADDQQPWVDQEGVEWLDLIGRFATLDARRRAEAALAGTVRTDLSRRLQIYPSDPELQAELRGADPRFESFARGGSHMRAGLVSPLVLLQIAVLLTLAISCSNAANILLARGLARRGEIATRQALGASSRRLLRQLVTEGTLMVGLAIGLGLVAARWGRWTLAAALALPLPAVFDASLDWRMLVFAVTMVAGAVLLFAVLPAARLNRFDILDALRRGAVGQRTTSRLGATRVLVSLQVGLAFVLVVGAVLLATTVRNLMTQDLGVDVPHLVSVSIGPYGDRVAKERLDPYDRSLLEQIESVPGVRRAATSVFPLFGNLHMSAGINIAGRQSSGETFHVEEVFVGRTYFNTLGMTLVAGRDFDERDTRSSPLVAVVGETLARRFFGDPAHALGQRFGLDTIDTEIVGVVRDARIVAVRAVPEPTVYFPLSQNASYPAQIEIATVSDPRPLMATLRRTIAAAAPELPIERLDLLADRVDKSLDRDRFVARWATGFGALALGLASFGLFGIMSFAVARRAKELAVRIALGATGRSIVGLVVRDAMTVVTIGLVIGIPSAIATARLTSDFLFGIAPYDPRTLLLASFVILAIGTAASLGPAWRASRSDPILALRED